MATRQLKKYCGISTCFRIVLMVLLIQLLLYFFKYKNGSEGNINIFDGAEYFSEDSVEYQYINRHLENASEGSWQNVTTLLAYKFLVFSAFLDIRRSRIIRLVAVTKTKKIVRSYNTVQPWCKLWYKISDNQIYARTVKGTLNIILEHWQLPYSAYYILCALNETDPVPDAVSVLSDPKDLPENFLKVIVSYDKQMKWNPSQISPVVETVAVCVKPFHYDYNQVLELLEFVELHQIMGVNHFFFYNHTVGPQVSCLLEKYQNEGLVTILPWQLPIESQKEIRTEGLFASLNDCLYRTMHRYSHSIFIDFDEFIIPSNKRTYKELFEHLATKKDLKRLSVFSFKNGFFYRQWPDDPDVKKFNDHIAENLIVLKKTTRRTELHPHRTRSKIIVRPELVNMVGNHFVWDYYSRKEYDRMDVDPSDAFLHHYRVCEFGGDDCVNHPSTVDKTAYKYKDELIEAVKTRYNKHVSDCKLDSITD